MKGKTILTAILLAFVAVSVVYLIVSSADNRTANTEPTPTASTDYIAAYYFHGNKRCPTCNKLEAYTTEAIRQAFERELADGRLQFKVLNYDEPGNEHYLDDYQMTYQSVIVVQMKDNQQVAWENLDKIWDLVSDKPAYIDYIQTGITKHLDAL